MKLRQTESMDLYPILFIAAKKDADIWWDPPFRRIYSLPTKEKCDALMFAQSNEYECELNTEILTQLSMAR